MDILPESIFNKGYLSTEEIMSQNIQFATIRNWENEGLIIKIDRGLYSLPYTKKDILAIMQHRYNRFIFSGITALNLHGLSDHISERIHVTSPKGYNPSSLKGCEWPLSITRVIPELYDLGISEMTTSEGNIVKVYDRERTLCDIMRGKGISSYLINNAMRAYFRSDDTEPDRIMDYAEKLHVRSKIEPYVEMMSQ